MKQQSIRTLFGYWNKVRAGRLAPHRLEIEPSRIAGALAETFMLERFGATSYSYRLAGTRVCELFGCELRGRNFLEGWSKEDRDVLERDLAAICEAGAIALLTLEGGDGPRHRLELEAILLPLMYAGNKITRILGAISAACAPMWLATQPLRRCQLLRHELVWPDGRPYRAQEGAGQPREVAKRSGAPIAGSRHHLRVLQGGRSEEKRKD